MTFRRLTLICLMTQIALCSAFCVFAQTVMGPSPKSTATPPKVIIDPGYHRLQLSTGHAYAQISQDGKFTIYCDHGSLVLDLNTGAMNFTDGCEPGPAAKVFWQAVESIRRQQIADAERQAGRITR
jgi:hypothetical protein